jgi:hypothetical protein
MAFLCPDCGRYSLKITSSLELAGDSRSDEITLQVIKCEHCPFEGIAVYEESRRGALDDDSFDHRGFRVSKDSVLAIKRAIRHCPSKKNPRCTCETHKALGSKSASGRWNGLDEVELEDPFFMRR